VRVEVQQIGGIKLIPAAAHRANVRRKPRGRAIAHHRSITARGARRGRRQPGCCVPRPVVDHVGCRPEAGKRAEIVGGLMLIGIGAAILYEHLSA